MRHVKDKLDALWGAVLCVCACLMGCGRGDAVSPAPPAPAATNAPAKKAASRAGDAAYQAQLQNFVAENRLTYAERQRIQKQMAQIRERAKKELPANATDEQVLAEIENNPRKYPAWRELVMALENKEEELKRNNMAAQATVRRRVLREVAEKTSAKQ